MLAHFLRRDLYFKAQAEFDAAGKTDENKRKNTHKNAHENFDNAEDEDEATEVLSRSFSSLSVKKEHIIKPIAPTSTISFESPRFGSPRFASPPPRISSTTPTTPRSCGKTKYSQENMSINTSQLSDYGIKAEYPKAPPFLQYDSIDDAKKDCDFWYVVDIEHPERTAPHLTVTLCEVQRVGQEKAELVKVCYNHLIDAHDYTLCNCWVVCHGRALVVWTPSVPRWQMEKEIHGDEEFKFHQKSPYLEETHTLKFNNIARDANRLLHKTLLLMPDGYVLTGQIKLPVNFDGEQVQTVPCEKEIDITVFGKQRKHVLRPVTWVLRNAAASRSFYQLDEISKSADPFGADLSAGTDFS